MKIISYAYCTECHHCYDNLIEIIWAKENFRTGVINDIYLFLCKSCLLEALKLIEENEETEDAKSDTSN